MMAVAETGGFVFDGITDVEVGMREEVEVTDISNVVVVEVLVVVTSTKDTVLDKELEGDGLCGVEGELGTCAIEIIIVNLYDRYKL